MTRTQYQLRRAVIIVMAALLGALLTAPLAGGDPAAPATVGTRSAALPADITEPAAAPPPTVSRATGSERREPTTAPGALSIPRLDLALPVLARGVDRSGAMALPRTPWAVSWYRFGAGPLSRAGATVLAGHVDTARHGIGPLARLGELRPGDRLLVRVGGRLVGYSVTSVTRVAKSVLDLPALFSRVGPPRLHLVTCGGAYLPDRGGYQDNVVVAARRTPA